MTEIKTTKIPQRQECVNKEHPYIGGAKDVIDDELGKPQSQVNSETNESLSTHAQQIEDLQAMEQIVIDGGEAQIAQGSDFDNPDSAKRAKIPTVGAVLDGINQGAFDLTAKTGDSYASLQDALTAANTAIPANKKRGGMQLSFVHSVDNKYVQFRCKAQSFSIDPSDWVNVEDKLEEGLEAEAEARQQAINEQNLEIAEFEETITNQINNYSPIEIEGNVENAPDEEDLTSVNQSGTDVLKFKNRNNLNGMGYIILRRNASFESQLTQTNTIYEIRYDFDLGSETVTIPENCVLEFDGGSLSNGTLVGKNTCIYAGVVKIFNIDATISGTWNVIEAYPEWFGVVSRPGLDNTTELQRCIDSFDCIKFINTYRISRPLRIKGQKYIDGIYEKEKGSTNYGCILVLSDFSSVSITYQSITQDVSSVFYGYETGDNLLLQNLYINGNYKVESALYGHKKGNFNVTVEGCFFERFYGVVIRPTNSDHYIISRNKIRYSFFAIFVSSKDENVIENPFGSAESNAVFPNGVVIDNNSISFCVFGIKGNAVSNITITNNFIAYLSCVPIYCAAVGNSFIDNNYFEGNFHMSFNIAKDQQNNPIVTANVVDQSLLDILTTRIKNYRALIYCGVPSPYGNAYIGAQYMSVGYIRTDTNTFGISNDSNLQGLDSLFFIVGSTTGMVTIENPSAQKMGSKNLKYHIIEQGGVRLSCNIPDAMVYDVTLVNESSYGRMFNIGVKQIINNAFPKTTIYYLDDNNVEQTTQLTYAIFNLELVDGVLCAERRTGVYQQRINISSFSSSMSYRFNVLIKNPTNTSKSFNVRIVCNNNGTVEVIKKSEFAVAANSVIKLSQIFDIVGVSGDYLYIYLVNDGDLIYSPFVISTLSEDFKVSNELYVDRAPNASLPTGFDISCNGQRIRKYGQTWKFFDNTLAARFYNEDGYWKNIYYLSGTYANRPKQIGGYEGFKYFDTDLGIYIYWKNPNWVNEDGINMDNVQHIKGTTATRTLMADQSEEIHIGTDNEGLKYYDTDLHKYVLWNGSAWVNLDGSALLP